MAALNTQASLALRLNAPSSGRQAASLSAGRSAMAGTALKPPVKMGGNKQAVGRVALETVAFKKIKGLDPLVKELEKLSMKKEEEILATHPGLPSYFKPGYEVKVGVTVTEGQKTRVQSYQGIILAIKKAGVGSSILVRKVVDGVGVERSFPIHSPLCTFEYVKGQGIPKVRRAKLYYLRKLSGKKAKLKFKF